MSSRQPEVRLNLAPSHGNGLLALHCALLDAGIRVILPLKLSKKTRVQSRETQLRARWSSGPG